jgi:peptidoglycan/xylan/chitin deacetylase (PgdA/CDA1 family)
MHLKLLRRVRRSMTRVLPYATILLYHRVAREGHDPWGLCVTPEYFAEQMQVLAKMAQVVPLRSLPDAIGARRSSRPMVALTFDDGYLDNLQTAKPILERYGLPATVFLISGWLGRARLFWWDELTRLVFEPSSLPGRLSFEIAGDRCEWQAIASTRQALHDGLWRLLQPLADACQQDALEQISAWAGVPRPAADAARPLTPDEALQIAEGGVIEIGAHTETHRPLDRLERRAQAREIEGSKAALEKLFGRRIESFSFPYGARGRTAARLVLQAGFVRACTSKVSSLFRGTNPLALPRIVVGDWDGAAFERRLGEGIIG